MAGEYSAANSRRDFDEALRIIRRISRLNPEDANTTKQVERMEKQFLDRELGKLQHAVTRGNRVEIIEIMEFVQDVSPGCEGNGSVWDEAMGILLEARREDATVTCERLSSQAKVAYEKGDLELARTMVAEVTALVEDYGVALETSSESIKKISEWCRNSLQKLTPEN